MAILCAGKTDIGRKRKTNQDAIYLNKEKRFFIVADGMGGHKGGDIASAMAVKHIPEYILKNQKLNPSDNLEGAILYANDLIKKKGQSDTRLVGMGTTVVGIYIHKGIAHVCNVGDSRGYLIQNKVIYQMTRDHSLVQEKLNVGIYDRENAKNDPNKNVLVRTVGFEDDVEVDIFTYKICRNDIFLYCSDGLSGKVNDEDIIFILNKYIPDPAKATEGQLHEAVQALIDNANENGGQDNISVILVLAQ